MVEKTNVETLAHAICLHGDSIRAFTADETKEIKVESIKYLHYRKKSPWWPYLLTAGLVASVSYASIYHTSKEDAWFTPNQKGLMGAYVFGGLSLVLSLPIKEMNEQRQIIHKRRGIADSKRIKACY